MLILQIGQSHARERECSGQVRPPKRRPGRKPTNHRARPGNFCISSGCLGSAFCGARACVEVGRTSIGPDKIVHKVKNTIQRNSISLAPDIARVLAAPTPTARHAIRPGAKKPAPRGMARVGEGDGSRGFRIDPRPMAKVMPPISRREERPCQGDDHGRLIRGDKPLLFLGNEPAKRQPVTPLSAQMSSPSLSVPAPTRLFSRHIPDARGREA
jgi:hypothetical protein